MISKLRHKKFKSRIHTSAPFSFLRAIGSHRTTIAARCRVLPDPMRWFRRQREQGTGAEVIVGLRDLSVAPTRTGATILLRSALGLFRPYLIRKERQENAQRLPDGSVQFHERHGVLDIGQSQHSPNQPAYISGIQRLVPGEEGDQLFKVVSIHRVADRALEQFVRYQNILKLLLKQPIRGFVRVEVHEDDIESAP